MMPGKPSLDIIVANWNSGEHLRRCIHSIQSARSDTYRLTMVSVIDNASTDGSVEIIDGIEVSGLPVKILRQPDNFGFAAACNAGAGGSRADYLLFLNPDVRLFRETLNRTIERMESRDLANVGILGIQLLDERGGVQRNCARFPTPWRSLGQSLGLDRLLPKLVPPHFMRDWAHDRSRPVDQVMGAYFLVRRNVFEQLRGFDERFFLYFEDVDFCLRARRLGWQTFYSTDAQAIHVGGGCSAAIPALRLIYNLRSRLAFARKHFGFSGRLIVFVATLAIEPLSRIAFASARLFAAALVPRRART